MKIVGEARNPPPSSTPIRGFSWGAEENEEGNEDIDAEVEEGDDEEDEYDKRVKEVHASGEFRERLDWAESNVCVLCCIFSSFFFFFFFVPAALFDQVNCEQCTDVLFMSPTNSTF